jgi:hypothetical protein
MGARVRVNFQTHNSKLVDGKPSGDLKAGEKVEVGEIIFGVGQNAYVKANRVMSNEIGLSDARNHAWGEFDKRVLGERPGDGIFRAWLSSLVNDCALDCGMPMQVAWQFIAALPDHFSADAPDEVSLMPGD